MIDGLRRWRSATIIALWAVTAATAVAAGPADDEIAARVNGTVIWRKSVREVVLAIANAQDEPPSSKQVEQFTREALDSLIAFELLYQESQHRGISVSEADIEESITDSKTRFPSPEDYADALAKQGMSSEDVRNETRKALLVNRLLEEVVWQGLSISSERVRQFYEENREEFRRPAQVRASHILVRIPPGAGAADRAREKKKADDLLAQIKAGADFAELARQHSQDQLTATKAGDLGFFSRGTMDQAIEEAAFNLKPGETSNLVETRYGFHLLKLTDRRAAGYAPLPEVEDTIRALLREEEQRRRQDQLVVRLKQEARIEVLPGVKRGKK